jgi:hypothetical protein
MLLVAGNPLDDISLLAQPEASLMLIMKGGVIHRNAL